MAKVVFLNILSCAPMEPSSTKHTSSVIGGLTLIVLRLRVFTVWMKISLLNVKPLLLLPQTLNQATLPLKLLLTIMVQMHQEKDADKAAVKAEDKVKNWTDSFTKKNIGKRVIESRIANYPTSHPNLPWIKKTQNHENQFFKNILLFICCCCQLLPCHLWWFMPIKNPSNPHSKKPFKSFFELLFPPLIILIPHDIQHVPLPVIVFPWIYSLISLHKSLKTSSNLLWIPL